MTRGVVSVCFSFSLLIAPLAPAQEPLPPSPSQEAVAPCAGRESGASCVLQQQGPSRTGTCQRISGGALACVLDARRPEALEACANQ